MCTVWIAFLQYKSNFPFTALKTWQWLCACSTFRSIPDRVASGYEWGFLHGFCWWKRDTSNRPSSPHKLNCLPFMIIIHLHSTLCKSVRETSPLTCVALSTWK